MKKLGLTFVALCCLIGCKDNSKPFEVSKNGVTLTLPGYINEEELAEDAIFEYANRYRNFYIAGFEMPASMPLDSVRIISARRIYSSLEKYELQYSKDRDSNLTTTIKGQFKEEPEMIYYYQKILIGGDKRYVLTVWIRGDERKKKYFEDIQSILYSFRVK